MATHDDQERIESDLELGENEPLYEGSAPSIPVYASVASAVSCQLIFLKHID
jgi:hypothetical protein